MTPAGDQAFTQCKNLQGEHLYPNHMTEPKRYLTQFWFRIQEVYLEGIVSHQREVSVKHEQNRKPSAPFPGRLLSGLQVTGAEAAFLQS